jgi:hypothetical protein
MALPTLPTPPSRGMTPDAFNDAAEAFMAALGAWSTALDSALGWTTIGTLTTTSGTTQDFTSIPQTYNDLLVVVLGVSFTASINMTMALGNAPAVFATGQAIAASAAAGSDTFYGGIYPARLHPECRRLFWRRGAALVGPDDGRARARSSATGGSAGASRACASPAARSTPVR